MAFDLNSYLKSIKVKPIEASPAQSPKCAVFRKIEGYQRSEEDKRAKLFSQTEYFKEMTNLIAKQGKTMIMSINVNQADGKGKSFFSDVFDITSKEFNINVGNATQIVYHSLTDDKSTLDTAQNTIRYLDRRAMSYAGKDDVTVSILLKFTDQ